MFDSLSSKFSDLFGSLRRKGRITPEDIESTCQELRNALLEADVALSVTEGFVEKIR
ncbi:MAG: signal recognition particle receptor subunit alpha, partial [Candidatus Nanopelagicaceae bacterium]